MKAQNWYLRACALILLGAATAVAGHAQLLNTLASFDGTNGEYAYAPLVRGSDGNFYGTTYDGGANSEGTIFKMAPDGTLTTLYNFCSQTGCVDGALPYSGLVQGWDGNFYGTANSDGANSEGGVVFKITPDGSYSVLYSFCTQSSCTDGAFPYGGLVRGTDGNFYGTTSAYGPSGGGTVFKITPAGALTTLYGFCAQSNCADGGGPESTLIQAPWGTFFGTTNYGGVYGYGTVFGITASGVLATQYSFCALNNCTDGAQPYAGLTLGADNYFYGTTICGGSGTTISYCNGGAGGAGTVFKMSPGGALTTLYSFCSLSNCDDGLQPYAGILKSSDGTLYGATSDGGAGPFHIGGTLFYITPAGALTTVYSFCQVSGCPNGEGPYGAMIRGRDGNYYGTTFEGGSDGNGTVFQLLAVPLATVPTDSLVFGNQDLGTTSPPQMVTSSNTGTAALAVTSIATSADFAETNNCPSTLLEGNSCTISVFFTPTQIGKRTGTLTITDNSNGVPGSQQTVSLTGTGINPEGSVSPTSLAFGNEAINTTSATKKVTLTSTGTANLMNISITISGTNAGDFAQTNSCPASMAPGSKCIIDVNYTPSILGAESATLNVSDNAANTPQTVALAGTGAGDVTLNPASAGFGNVAINTPSNTKNFTLKNNQPVTLSISSIGVTGTNAGDFSQAGTCGSSLAGKSSCTISVTFTPSALAAEAATLTVSDNAPAPYNTLSSSLTGTGVADVTLTPASAGFGEVAIDTASNPRNFTLKNNQLATLSISSIALSGANAGDFSQAGTCGAGLAGKSSCVISVTFTPSALAAEAATVTVSDNAPAPYNTLTSSLTGTGEPQATVTPASLNFGGQTVGTTSAPKNLTLKNDLLTALNISSISFTGTDPGDFAVQSTTCGGSLASKSTCTISVTFTPAAKGVRSATLNVNDSGNNSPQTVSLAGTGK